MDEHQPIVFKALDVDADLVLEIPNGMFHQSMDSLYFLSSEIKKEIKTEQVEFARFFAFDEKNMHLAISIHLDSTDRALFSVKMEDEGTTKLLEHQKNRAEANEFKGVQLYTLKTDKKRAFYFAHYEDLLLASGDRWQVEGAIIRIKEGKTYFNESARKMKKYAPSAPSAFHVYFNPNKVWKSENKLAFSTGSYLSDAFKSYLKQARLDWTAEGPYLDALINRDAEWSAWEKKVDYTDFLDVLPADCVGFVLLSGGPFYHLLFSPYLDGKSMVRVQTQTHGEPSLSIYKLKNQARVMEALEKSEEYKVEQTYQSFVIWANGRKENKQYYLIYNDRLLVSSKIMALRSAVDQYVVGAVLSKEAAFLELLQKCPAVMMGGVFSREDPLVSFSEDVDVPAGWYAWPWVDGSAFNHAGPLIYVAGTEKKTKTAAIAWKLPLESTAAGSVRALRFPKLEEIGDLYFVQDVAGNLSCFDANALVHWKAELPQLLGSEVYQVDYLDSEKPFYLFSTYTQVWLLDEKGVVVEGFPIDFNTPISSGLFATDFGRKKDYVFFVASEDGQVLGFDKNGKPLEGWNPGPSMVGVEWPFQHLRRYKDDYIFIVSQTGLLAAYDRFGKAHFPTIQLGGTPISPISLSTGSDEPLVILASKNTGFQSFSLDGQAQCVAGKSVQVATDMVTAPVHLTNPCYKENAFFLEQKQLGVYSMNCSKSLERIGTIGLPIDADTLFRRSISKEVVLLGALDRRLGYFFAYDNLGESLFEYKLAGETPFVLAFDENGRLAKVLTTKGSEVWAYRVD